MNMLVDKKYPIEKYAVIADEYSKQFRHGMATKDNLNYIIDRIDKSLTLCLFKIACFQQSFKNALNKFYFLQNTILEKNVAIFGMYYRNRFNEEVIEDDETVTKVRFCLSHDCFIFDGMFFGALGEFKNNVLEITEIVLPHVNITPVERPDLLQKSINIAFFGQIKINASVLNKLKTTGCDILVLTGSFKDKEIADVMNSFRLYHAADIIMVPGKKKFPKTLLPINFKITSQNANVHMASNPARIQLFDQDIIIVNDDICRKKNHGVFLGANYYESFGRTFISQYTYNFDLGFKDMSNMIFVGQDTQAFIVEHNGVILASSGACDGVYIEYNTMKKKAVIKHLLE